MDFSGKAPPGGMYPGEKYRLKTAQEYASESNTTVPVLRKYLRYSRLEDVIMKCPMANKLRMSEEQRAEEMRSRECFLDLIKVKSFIQSYLMKLC